VSVLDTIAVASGQLKYIPRTVTGLDVEWYQMYCWIWYNDRYRHLTYYGGLIFFLS
jgi:hypothetical protein